MLYPHLCGPEIRSCFAKITFTNVYGHAHHLNLTASNRGSNVNDVKGGKMGWIEKESDGEERHKTFAVDFELISDL